MSNKGNSLSATTRGLISKSKTKHTKANLIQSANDYIEHLRSDEKELPTLAGFCLVAGIHPTNLSDYTIKYPEVNQLVSYIALMQEQYCLTRGIRNQANPIFSMFLLKSKHQYHDQPQQLNQTNNFNISPDLLADALKIMSKK